MHSSEQGDERCGAKEATHATNQRPVLVHVQPHSAAFMLVLLAGKTGEMQRPHCAADLAGLQSGQARQLQFLLLDPEPLCTLCNVSLAQLAALLVLYGGEHAKRPVLACAQTWHAPDMSIWDAAREPQVAWQQWC